MLRKVSYFFVYSNLFIAICAVMMVDQTSHFLLHRLMDLNLAGFVFFSTLCSYSFHWYLTDQSITSSSRIHWLKINRRLHVIFFFLGAAGSAYFFFRLIDYWYWLLLVAAVTFLYSAPKIPHPIFKVLRKVALGKTIFLAFVWMFVTTVLPIEIAGQHWQPDYTWFVLSRFFLIYPICILFDYRDREDDKQAQIRSLITYLNEKAITIVFSVSLLIFLVTTLLLLGYHYPPLSIFFLLVPGMIVAALYRFARRYFGDIFYYFVLDGLMAFSAFLMLVTDICSTFVHNH